MHIWFLVVLNQLVFHWLRCGKCEGFLTPTPLDTYTTLYRPPIAVCSEFEVERVFLPHSAGFSYTIPSRPGGSILLFLEVTQTWTKTWDKKSNIYQQPTTNNNWGNVTRNGNSRGLAYLRLHLDLCLWQLELHSSLQPIQPYNCRLVRLKMCCFIEHIQIWPRLPRCCWYLVEIQRLSWLRCILQKNNRNI
jgi:hypothetical protein